MNLKKYKKLYRASLFILLLIGGMTPALAAITQPSVNNFTTARYFDDWEVETPSKWYESSGSISYSTAERYKGDRALYWERTSSSTSVETIGTGSLNHMGELGNDGITLSIMVKNRFTSGSDRDVKVRLVAYYYDVMDDGYVSQGQWSHLRTDSNDVDQYKIINTYISPEYYEVNYAYFKIEIQKTDTGSSTHGIYFDWVKLSMGRSTTDSDSDSKISMSVGLLESVGSSGSWDRQARINVNINVGTNFRATYECGTPENPNTCDYVSAIDKIKIEAIPKSGFVSADQQSFLNEYVGSQDEINRLINQDVGYEKAMGYLSAGTNYLMSWIPGASQANSVKALIQDSIGIYTMGTPKIALDEGSGTGIGTAWTLIDVGDELGGYSVNVNELIYGSNLLIDYENENDGYHELEIKVTVEIAYFSTSGVGWSQYETKTLETSIIVKLWENPDDSGGGGTTPPSDPCSGNFCLVE